MTFSNDFMIRKQRRRLWILGIWVLVVSGFACVIVFWPPARNVDEYTNWPMFRLLGFGVTWFPILVIVLAAVLWLEGKVSRAK
jgi:hypothetical protein